MLVIFFTIFETRKGVTSDAKYQETTVLEHLLVSDQEVRYKEMCTDFCKSSQSAERVPFYRSGVKLKMLPEEDSPPLVE